MLRRSHSQWTMRTAFSLLFVALLFTVAVNVAAQSTTGENRTADAGSLQTLDEKGNPSGLCPLKHTDVKAEISGYLSRVTVTQQFINPFPNKIEAVYKFPLPQAAAVDDMTMLVGARVVKGKIMRREAAQAAYDTAKQMGKVASLLNQERPNIFTQAVANILPGDEVRITISYVETLQYEDGSYEWSFPMVVGERYIPDSVDGDEAARISPPRAPNGSRAGHDLSLEINLNAGVPIQSLNSETHQITIERSGDNSAVVRLQDRATIPNKDFVLKYQVAGNVIDDALLAHRTDRGGFFTLILQPPQRVTAAEVMPKELVFVLDSSGSMEGFPFEKARETLMLALDNLYPNDTFNVITFAGETRILFSDPVPATRENIHKAKKLLSKVGAEGGTEMMKAIKAALDPSDSQQRVRIVCFMTDGQVGNDEEIIAEVKKHPNARVFAMGFSDAPNRYLLDKITEYGRGEVEYVQEKGDTPAVARRFHERVRNPLLTDLSIDWSNLPVTDVYPKTLPDLFSAKPVTVSGRYANGGKGTIRLKGRMAGQDFVREIPIELPDTEPAHDVLATLWARRRIDDLMVQLTSAATNDPKVPEQAEEITQLGLDFRLMTKFTSFVAVDDALFTGSEDPQRVDVPVEGTTTVYTGNVTTGSVAGLVNYVTVSSTTSNSMGLACGSVTTTVHQDLPLAGRSLTRLVALAPGAVWTGSDALAPASQVNVSVNGQRASRNSFVLDGVSFNDGIAPGGESPGTSAAGTTPALTASGGPTSVIPLAAVQEVTVTSQPIEPEYGRVPGAQVNLTTRVGTNAFHGSLFYFFGNNATDANDWFANSRNLTQSARHLNNFGGTLGGPVVKDKTFFFGAYEGLRLQQPQTLITDVPTLDARQSAPASVRAFLNAFPLPNGNSTGDGLAEFAAAFANPTRHDVAAFRLDHNANNETMFSLRYNFADSDATMRGARGFSLNTRNSISSRSQAFTASLARTLSPAKMLVLRGNYSRVSVGGSYVVDQFGGAVVPPQFLNPGNDSFAFDLNARSASLMSGGEVANTQRQFNLVGSLEMISRVHDFKFGADYRRLSPIITSRAREANVLFDGVAQALTGVATRVNQLTHLTPQTPVFHNLSVYAQDDWRQSPRLTLTYGARWELNPAPEDPFSGARLWRTNYANVAPRFSFARQLSGTDQPQLILRGGVGLYYDLGQEFAGDAFVDSIPFLGGTSTSNSAFVPGGDSLPFIRLNPNLRLPFTVNWNLSLQRALGPSQTVEFAYVGSAGRRLLSTQTLFDTDPQFPFLRLIDNRAESNYRALRLQFERRLADGFRALVSYGWARSTDDANLDTARRVLFASANPEADFGPSDFDVRHALNGSVAYSIPAPVSEGWGNTLLRNWTIESLFMARSAKPLNALYGFPTSYGFVYVRPDVVNGSFVLPLTLEQGNLGRNSLRGFPFYQVDLGVSRKLYLTSETTLQFQADAFNLFNHPNFADPAGENLHLPTFGQPTALAGRGFDSFYIAGGSRMFRFSLKLTF